LSIINAICFLTFVVSSGICKGWGFNVWSLAALASVVRNTCLYFRINICVHSFSYKYMTDEMSKKYFQFYVDIHRN
jgi:hypothetical protein